MHVQAVVGDGHSRSARGADFGNVPQDHAAVVGPRFGLVRHVLLRRGMLATFVIRHMHEDHCAVSYRAHRQCRVDFPWSNQVESVVPHEVCTTWNEHSSARLSGATAEGCTMARANHSLSLSLAVRVGRKGGLISMARSPYQAER